MLDVSIVCERPQDRLSPREAMRALFSTRRPEGAQDRFSFARKPLPRVLSQEVRHGGRQSGERVYSVYCYKRRELVTVRCYKIFRT